MALFFMSDMQQDGSASFTSSAENGVSSTQPEWLVQCGRKGCNRNTDGYPSLAVTGDEGTSGAALIEKLVLCS